MTGINQVRMIPIGWVFAFIALGPIRHLGPSIFYQSYCLMMNSVLHTFLSFPLSFGFRYYILIRPTPEPNRILLLVLGVYVLSLFTHIIYVFAETPSAEIVAYVEAHRPAYNLSRYTVTGNNMLTEPITFYGLSCVLVPTGPIYVFVMMMRYKVLKFLSTDSHKVRMLSGATLRGHRRLMTALTIQALLPLFIVFPGLINYGVYHLGIATYPVMEYLTFAGFSLFPVANPLVTFYCVRPYRTEVMRWFKKPVGFVAKQIHAKRAPSAWSTNVALSHIDTGGSSSGNVLLE